MVDESFRVLLNETYLGPMGRPVRDLLCPLLNEPQCITSPALFSMPGVAPETKLFMLAALAVVHRESLAFKRLCARIKDNTQLFQSTTSDPYAAWALSFMGYVSARYQSLPLLQLACSVIPPLKTNPNISMPYQVGVEGAIMSAAQITLTTRNLEWFHSMTGIPSVQNMLALRFHNGFQDLGARVHFGFTGHIVAALLHRIADHGEAYHGWAKWLISMLLDLVRLEPTSTRLQVWSVVLQYLVRVHGCSDAMLRELIPWMVQMPECSDAVNLLPKVTTELLYGVDGFTRGSRSPATQETVNAMIQVLVDHGFAPVQAVYAE